jgi:dipeptidyl aminopeptidase/acylaminoacyl peptidase
VGRQFVMLAVLAVAAVVATGSTGRSASSVPGKVVESVAAKYEARCWLTTRALVDKRSKPLTPPVRASEQRCDERPVWSPDGSRIAFVRRTGAKFGVMVVNADGTGLHRVAAVHDRPLDVWGLIWSPSGTVLLFQVDRRPATGTNALYRVGVDGSSLSLLAVQPDKPAFLRAYGWSPDGRRVVLVRSVGEPRYQAYTGPARLQTISPTGTGVKTLLVAQSVDWAAWSPDGRRMAFHRNCFIGICQLALVNPATGAVEALVHFAGHSNNAGIDQLTSLWRPGSPATIVYARDRTLNEVSPATGATRVVSQFPCPRKACGAIDVTFAAISSEGSYLALDAFDYSTFSDSSTDDEADRSYRVDLRTGQLERLPAFGDDSDVFLP